MSINAYDWLVIFVQLLTSTLCGGVIGYQRETSDRPAGFRTHILVCVGSTVYMLVSMQVANYAWAGGHVGDPGRIAAQVASGIGFLGAGTIIKQGSIVRGLTTAASLWTVAGIGLAVGFGGRAMEIAVIGTIMAFLALSLLRKLEVRFESNSERNFNIDVKLMNHRKNMDWVQQVLADHDIELHNIAIGKVGDGVGSISIEGRSPSRRESELAVRDLMKGEAVCGVRQLFRCK